PERGPGFDPGDILQRAPHERRVAPDVRLVAPEPKHFEANESRRVRGTQKEETDFHIATEIMREEERRVCRIQQDVHAARRPGQVIQGERRVRGGPMADNQETSHDNRMARFRLRVRGRYLFSYLDIIVALE